MKQQFRRHVLIISLYTVLALLLTWPLAAHIATHIPGEATWAFDESTFIWNMWWFKFSLLNLGQSPLHSSYIFFPLGVNLTTYTFNLFNTAFGLPLQLGLSLPLASNLTLLFSFVSSAYGMALLSLYLLTPPPPLTPHPKHASPLKTQHLKFNTQNLSLMAVFAAGAAYAFSASRMMYAALGHYNFVTIQWFPFYTLFLLKALRQGGLKNILPAALFAAFCLYAELTFSVFLLFITVMVGISEWRKSELASQRISESPLLRRSPAPPLPRLLLRLALIGLISFALTAPLIAAVLPDFLDPATAEPGWGEGLKLSADLAGLVTFTPLHPLAGVDWVAELRAVIEGRSRFSDANTLFLGYGILALALLGFAVRRREGRVWLWSALIFTVLSLGPLLTINGQNRFNLDGLDVTFPLPFALLHYLPIISANRVPNRFSIPLTMALAVLVGFAVHWILGQIMRRLEIKRLEIEGLEIKRLEIERLEIPQSPPPISQSPISQSPYLPISNLFTTHLPRYLVLLCLLTMLLFDQYSVPLPLTDARMPDVYTQIGAEPDDFTLIQLPLGWRNSYGTLGAERTQLQYYQAAHHRPMLGGNTSRNPAFLFDYFRRIPLFYALTQTELYHPVDDDTLQRARAQAAGLMTLYNIKYLVIHDPLPQRKPYEDTYLPTRKLALDLIPHHPQPVYQSPGVAAFAVEQAPLSNPLTLDFGHWSTDPNRGPGWAGNEDIFAATANWAAAPQAVIFFPARDAGSRMLRLQLAPFTYPGAPPQRLSLSLNDNPLPDSFWLHENWQVIEAPLPAAFLQTGLNRLTLHFDHTAAPRQALPANRAIGSTGLDTPVDLEVNSGADFAFITVDFGDNAVDASAHRRGVNVAVVDPATGRLADHKGFDTAANEFEAAALAAFIDQIPAGHLVLAATQGADAAAYLAPAALAAVGGPVDVPAPPFSLIGVKGAAPGTALLAAGEGAAYARLGAPPDTRPLAAAVDWVEISAP